MLRSLVYIALLVDEHTTELDSSMQHRQVVTETLSGRPFNVNKVKVGFGWWARPRVRVVWIQAHLHNDLRR